MRAVPVRSAAADGRIFLRYLPHAFPEPFPLDESGRCPLCRLGLTGFDAVYSYGSYEGSLRKLIHLFKYDKIYSLARPLAGFLARVLPREERFDAIVPMPLHWRRRGSAASINPSC